MFCGPSPKQECPTVVENVDIMHLRSMLKNELSRRVRTIAEDLLAIRRTAPAPHLFQAPKKQHTTFSPTPVTTSRPNFTHLKPSPNGKSGTKGNGWEASPLSEQVKPNSPTLCSDEVGDHDELKAEILARMGCSRMPPVVQ
ncbi:hypothetical protein SRHO_G00312390 [Serrasalmus rhombeus]